MKEKILQKDSRSQFLFIHLMCRYCHFLNHILYTFFTMKYTDTRTEKKVCLLLKSIHISVDGHYLKECEVPR